MAFHVKFCIKKISDKTNGSSQGRLLHNSADHFMTACENVATLYIAS